MGTLTSSASSIAPPSFPLAKTKLRGPSYEEETTETRSMTDRSGSRTDVSGRSAALERAYVHDVYENCEEPNGQIRPRVAQFLTGLEPGSLVCDVGCGNGRYLSGLNPLIYTIGVDRCYRLTQVAHGKDGEVAICDNLDLPFRDESFDAVLSLAVVHHFATAERRVGAIRELARILRIGGRVIITVWALEQRHRRFESQDVLVPWQPPRSRAAGVSDEEDDDDFLPPYHAYTEDSTNSSRSAGDGDSSSLSSSSPGETCYSFVRRAIQKLAGSKRSPWFMESWSSRETKHDSSLDYEDARDLPIELRRLEDFDDLPEPPLSAGLKSRSLGSILNPPAKTIVRSRSSVPSLGAQMPESKAAPATEPPVSRRPKLVKQKQSLCDDVDYKFSEASQAGYREHALLRNESRAQLLRKQSSLNEELMAESRLREKDRIRKRIQKQISLNETFLCRSLFTKRLQVIKEGFATKLKTSTGSLERVTKNGFVKIIQNIKAASPASYHPGGPGGATSGGHHHHHHHPGGGHHYGHQQHHHHHQHQHHLAPSYPHNTHGGPPGGRPAYCYDPSGCCGPACCAAAHPEYSGSSGHVGSCRFAGCSSGYRLSRNNSASGSGPGGNGGDGTGGSGVGGGGGGGGGAGSATHGHDKLLAAGMGSSQDDASKPRRHSRESGSDSFRSTFIKRQRFADSSKDSSLQSDTSIESEDSFASVIYIPKPDQQQPQQQQPTQPHQQQQVPPNGVCSVVGGGPNGANGTCSGGPSKCVPDLYSPGAVGAAGAVSRMPSTSVPTSPLVMPCPTPAHSPAPPRTKPDPGATPNGGYGSGESGSTAPDCEQRFTFEETAVLPWQMEQQQLVLPKEPTSATDREAFTPIVTTTTVAAATTLASSQQTCAGGGSGTSAATNTPAPSASVRTGKSTSHSSPQKSSAPQKITRQQIKDLPPIPKFRRSGNYPILRRQTSAAAGTSSAVPVPVPKLLSLELFNPETDDLDSDSSEPSSPDSIDSVISALRPPLSPQPAAAFHQPATGPPDPPVASSLIPPLVEAAAVVAHKLEDVVDMVIPARDSVDGKPTRFNGLLDKTSSTTAAQLQLVDLGPATHTGDTLSPSRQHLVDFAEKLSAQLLKELENEKRRNESFDDDNDDVFGTDSGRPGPVESQALMVDPYLKKLNGDLRDLSQLRAELRERRLMLANLSNLGSGSSSSLSGQFGGSNDSLGPSYSSSMAPIIQEEGDDEELDEFDDRRFGTASDGTLQAATPSTSGLAGVAKGATTSGKCGKNLGGKIVDDFVIIPEVDEDDPELSNDTALLIQDEDSSEEHPHGGPFSADEQRPSGLTSGFGNGTAASTVIDGQKGRRSKVLGFAGAQLGVHGHLTGDYQLGSSSGSSSCSAKDTSERHSARWNGASAPVHGPTIGGGPCLVAGTTIVPPGSGPAAPSERKPLSATKKSSVPSFESHTSVDSWAHSTSTASLDSPSVGGSATHHRYYHVFREGELDALINHHVTSLHIVSSYYERASWCVVAEKVHVWTI
ncbi:uncharacterized protein LOC131210858 [Anopheles bellator]|uniref:uncharacterized protein LOC131210858 n=1 Tax=Anopheles bellator TaxID=139047 RepID=UPI002649A9DA|nr:uncharacterized protein LOC131210858 [Anopheles bellator]